MTAPNAPGSLGGAQGSITISTATLPQAAQNVRAFTQQVNQAFNGVNTGSVRVESSFKNLGSVAKQFAGAFGISLGAAGAVQFGRFVVASTNLATAYERQNVAARSLAGSQERLNELLAAYDKATGNAIDKAQALSDVTKLQAVGFGDSAEELERFVTAARGISIAMGAQQDYVISQLQLAIANQSTMRLDQLGLGVSEVKRRVDELKASNRGLSQEMAYQQAVLGLAEEKFGALAKSAEGQATGVEKATKAWKDFRLEIGKATKEDVDETGEWFAGVLEGLSQFITDLKEADKEYEKHLNNLRNESGRDSFLSRTLFAPPGQFGVRQIIPWADPTPPPTALGRRQSPPPPPPRFSPEMRSLINDRYAAILEVEEAANKQRIAATRQYEEQRTSVIRDYGKTIAREAEDFALQRARAEQAMADSIADIHRDAQRRQVRMAEELARTIAQAEADSAERRAEFAEDHEERLADAREQSAKRISEIEENFQESRERATKDHAERLMNAAARLDAVAILQEQRNFARQQAEANKARDKQVKSEQEKLQERIDQENENYQERLEDEQKALDKRIRQAKEAADLQNKQAREADEQRIADMLRDFEKRKQEEDIDRGIRLRRLAEDHQDRLNEMARQHQLNLEQISTQKAEERAKIEEEFEKELDAIGIRTEKYAEKLRKREEEAEKSFDKFWNYVNNKLSERIPLPSTGGSRVGLPELIPSFALGGIMPFDGLAYLHRNERITPAGQAAMSRSITIAPGAIAIYGAPGQSEELIGQIVERRMIRLLSDVAGEGM